MSLCLTDLTVRLKKTPPLFPALTLCIEPGEVATVMGPSGVGKSTLLDAVAGLLSPTFILSGQITLNGVDISPLPAEARRIGLMFQDAVLFPHLSVGDNLAFGLSRTVKGRRVRRDTVQEALTDAGLPGMYDRDPASLSGGQKSRAALMRTLLADPAALLLDEPFSKLDAGLRDEMRGFTFTHIRKREIPTLMVTHDPEDAEATNGPIITLSKAETSR
ncbi:ATP-binding cassette domain-containing protein [Primorskyibacter marinus]|uniref:ATP-binding cassette domain-containing protein n=1 Tax=Primorskyibacter marinus TaxID=1977320 RepID=UPI000E306241|nr:ATP-binding cassette domain-containing protein [Primorskyibacter marinus]